MTNITKQEKSTAVILKDYFVKNKAELQRRTPSHLKVDRILSSAISAINTNPTLAKCTPRSLFLSTAQAANLGFELNNAMNEAWLVPRRITNKSTGNKVWTAGMIPGYQGLINLARRCSDVTIIFGEVIRKCDKWRIDRGMNNLHHEINLEGTDKTPVGFYAKYYLSNGQSDFVILDMTEIQHIRSKAETQVIWNEWFIDMGKKSAIKKLCKVMPKSSELLERKRLAQAIAVDNAMEVGEEDNLEDFIDIQGMEVPGEQAKEEVKKESTKKTTEQLKQRQTVKPETAPPPPAPPDMKPAKAAEATKPLKGVDEEDFLKRFTEPAEPQAKKSGFP